MTETVEPAHRTTLQRQPIVRRDRSVFGYAVRAVVIGPDGTPTADERVEHLLDAEYRLLDVPALAGDRPVMLRATTRLFLGEQTPPATPHGLVLEVPPALVSRTDAIERLTELHRCGVRSALGGYRGSLGQDVLLAFVDHVKVDVSLDPDQLGTLVRRAHAAGATVIGERADTPERIRVATELGVDLLQGPMFERRPATTGRDFTAGELQCLELLRLLSGRDAVQDRTAKIAHAVASDPELTMRVLHLVNSTAAGVRQQIDSVHQAVVLVGPQQLSALALASLIEARPATVGVLWAALVRALTCQTLVGSDAGYTMGLLSAVTAQQRLSVEDVVSRSGVSPDIAAALRDLAGPYGPALAAVLAHEENDSAGVRATGLEPFDVAHAYLAAVPEALATATALSVPFGP